MYLTKRKAPRLSRWSQAKCAQVSRAEKRTMEKTFVEWRSPAPFLHHLQGHVTTNFPGKLPLITFALFPRQDTIVVITGLLNKYSLPLLRERERERERQRAKTIQLTFFASNVC